MNLIIDVGNTRAKLAIFDGDNLRDKMAVEALTLPLVQGFLSKTPIGAVKAAIFSASGHQNTEGVLEWLNEMFFFLDFSHQTLIPITKNYETPETLGKDRLAGAVAAAALFANKNVLFIDAGTCITFNIVRADATFWGGNIAPGLSMRLKAMHHFTARLPLLQASKDVILEPKSWVGKSTQQAMLNGAHLGIVAEIEGIIQRFSAQFTDLEVIITGGDADFLVKNLNVPHIHHYPHLVLMGLNGILNFNLKK